MADLRKECSLHFGLDEVIAIETPTEEQLRMLRDYIEKDVNVERIFNFHIVDDDGDILSGSRNEKENIRLEEVTESSISGIAHNKQINMKFLEDCYDPFIVTNYYGLNHPLGLRSGSGKRYIAEINCGDEVLYKATLK